MAQKRILIVDDYINSRKLLTQLLENLGCETVFAWHASEAIGIACSCRPDMIFSELALPDAIGYDLIRCLRLFPDLEKTPIVIASYAGDRETALKNGATAYIRKPLDLYAVREVVRSFLWPPPKKKGANRLPPPHRRRAVIR